MQWTSNSIYESMKTLLRLPSKKSNTMFIVCLYVCVFVGMYLSNLSPLEGLEYLAAFFCLGHYHSLLLILNLKVCSLVGK